MLSGFWNSKVSDSAGIISFELVPVMARQGIFSQEQRKTHPRWLACSFTKQCICCTYAFTHMYVQTHTLEAKRFPCWG